MEKLFLERLKTLTILYAEDEEGIRENVAASLRYYVKEVIEAENGKMALELYEAKHPDIVITDILMPLMNGIDLVKQIRKKDQTTPILCMNFLVVIATTLTISIFSLKKRRFILTKKRLFF